MSKEDIEFKIYRLVLTRLLSTTQAVKLLKRVKGGAEND